MNFEIFKTASFQGHKQAIYDLSEGLSSDSFISAAGDGYLADWVSPEKGVPIAKVEGSIYAFEYLKDRNEIIVGENSNGLHTIDTLNKTVKSSLKLGKVSVFSIVTTGNKTLVGNSLGYVHIVNNLENKFIHHIEASSKSARTIAINPNDNEFAVGFSDHSIRIYDLDTYQHKNTIAAHKNSVFSLMYYQNTLISTGRDAHINVWDVSNNYVKLDSVPAHNYAINHIIHLEGTSLLASCSMDKSIKIWDLKDMQLLKVIDKAKHASHGTSVNKLWWNTEKQRLYSGSDDRTISEWKLF